MPNAPAGWVGMKPRGALRRAAQGFTVCVSEAELVVQFELPL